MHNAICVARCVIRCRPNDVAVRFGVNTIIASRRQLMEALKNEAEQIEATLYSPDGVTFSNPTAAIPELDAFKAGWFQVQDEAAQLVSILLDPQPGEVVLDACAGLGGKTGHIAQLMQNKGVLVALDIMNVNYCV